MIYIPVVRLVWCIYYSKWEYILIIQRVQVPYTQASMRIRKLQGGLS
jgi:hypothetical protein